MFNGRDPGMKVRKANYIAAQEEAIYDVSTQIQDSKCRICRKGDKRINTNYSSVKRDHRNKE